MLHSFMIDISSIKKKVNATYVFWELDPGSVFIQFTRGKLDIRDISEEQPHGYIHTSLSTCSLYVRVYPFYVVKERHTLGEILLELHEYMTMDPFQYSH